MSDTLRSAFGKLCNFNESFAVKVSLTLEVW